MTTNTTTTSNSTANTNAQETNHIINGIQEKELRLVLIGKSGHGKSSFGNTICGRAAFSTSASCSSHTKRCCPASRTLNGIELIVYDTPGLFDTNVGFDVIKREICKAVTTIAAPGPHAFIIVLQVGRFTNEEQETVQLINDIFGENAGRYCILILTREDDLENDGTSVQQYIADSTQEFRNLLGQCRNRYLAVNNRASVAERLAKVHQLIDIVKQMLRENQSAFYTNEMFRNAEEVLRQREKTILDQAEEEEKARIEEQRRTMREEMCRELEENSQRQLAELEKRLRDYQRNEYAAGQPVNDRAFWEFAIAAVNNGGMLLGRAIDFYERRSYQNQTLSNIRQDALSLRDDQNNIPMITYPSEQTALPSSHSTESNIVVLPVENDESHDSLPNKQT